MFMIDSVELILFQKIHQVRHFEDRDAVRAEQNIQSRHQILEVADVGENIVADNDLGRSFAFPNSARATFTEEVIHRNQSGCIRTGGKIVSWFHPKGMNSMPLECLQQTAVVAAHLQH